VTASSDTTYAITGPSKATQQGIAAKLVAMQNSVGSGY